MRRLPRPGDYPRVCGGTGFLSPGLLCRYGLSPRVRGNQARSGAVYVPYGTIPACAGEPNIGSQANKGLTDYPRVCGGTKQNQKRLRWSIGLSPRVRGNQGQHVPVDETEGTIPACAGEPQYSRTTTNPPKDYPRVCGGTRKRLRTLTYTRGLSPRVRGNPVPPAAPGRGRRTIPACAGEPTPTALPTRRLRDYPRVCGGTQLSIWGGQMAEGLSPRVRGNPLRALSTSVFVRTIPACAGEPCLEPGALIFCEDYPRVCGGTQG